MKTKLKSYPIRILKNMKISIKPNFLNFFNHDMGKKNINLPKISEYDKTVDVAQFKGGLILL